MPTEQELHEGKVVKISENTVHVEIVVSEACHQCKGKESCMAFNSKERIIDIDCSNPQDFKIGENVEVKMDTSLGFKAVAYAYVLPVIFLIGGLVIGTQLIKQELIVVLISISILVLYYLLLYLLRKKINRKFKFNIVKKI